jgi:hypothetical protein
MFEHSPCLAGEFLRVHEIRSSEARRPNVRLKPRRHTIAKHPVKPIVNDALFVRGWYPGSNNNLHCLRDISALAFARMRSSVWGDAFDIIPK